MHALFLLLKASRAVVMTEELFEQEDFFFWDGKDSRWTDILS